MSADLDSLLRAAPPWPERIVCLTEETTEILYRIGQGDRVVGISGYTVRPPEARKKPKISSFLAADYEQILELQPDLVLGFSDLQAELARELVLRGVPVHLFNQRSIAEILQVVRVVCALVGCAKEGEALAAELEAHVRAVYAQAAQLPRRPRIVFEEWDDPYIVGIRWVSELIEIAGGEDACAESRSEHAAAGRTYELADIAARNPDAIIASWCGRKASREKIVARPGWSAVRAVQDDQLYEIKSAYILQPGPAALTAGLDQLFDIIAAVANGEQLPPPREGFLRQAAATVA